MRAAAGHRRFASRLKASIAGPVPALPGTKALYIAAASLTP